MSTAFRGNLSATFLKLFLNPTLALFDLIRTGLLFVSPDGSRANRSQEVSVSQTRQCHIRAHPKVKPQPTGCLSFGGWLHLGGRHHEVFSYRTRPSSESCTDLPCRNTKSHWRLYFCSHHTVSSSFKHVVSSPARCMAYSEALPGHAEDLSTT